MIKFTKTLKIVDLKLPFQREFWDNDKTYTKPSKQIVLDELVKLTQNIEHDDIFDYNVRWSCEIKDDEEFDQENLKYWIDKLEQTNKEIDENMKYWYEYNNTSLWNKIKSIQKRKILNEEYKKLSNLRRENEHIISKLKEKQTMYCIKWDLDVYFKE